MLIEMPGRTLTQVIREVKRRKERRRAPRYQFIADAEVTPILFAANLKVKTGDLSLGGCFIDMPNPLPEGTEIRLKISHANAEFAAIGRVVFVFPNLGMGVVFTAVEADQQVVLRNWIAELSRGLEFPEWTPARVMSA